MCSVFCAVAFGILKSFDMFWHAGLLHNIKSNGFSGRNENGVSLFSRDSSALTPTTDYQGLWRLWWNIELIPIVHNKLRNENRVKRPLISIIPH